jgi:hypothetical protein
MQFDGRSGQDSPAGQGFQDPSLGGDQPEHAVQHACSCPLFALARVFRRQHGVLYDVDAEAGPLDDPAQTVGGKKEQV